ncbi:YncE family protein [Wenyingzhuangia sp. IMCC45467]
MKVTKLICKLFLLSLVFVSCNDDDGLELITQNVFEAINSEVIVSSEGNFNSKDGSVSYFGKNHANVFYYNEVNGAKLGGLVQSMAFSDTKAYIILNDVNQIVVVNKNTFVKEAVVETGLSNPRYMTIVGDKGYITNWGVTGDEASEDYDDYIAVLNLTTNTIEETNITEGLPFGPEQIVSANNGKVYVSHNGAWGTNNKVSVIQNNQVLTTIEVGDAPDELIIDDNGNLLVLSQDTAAEYNEDWTTKSTNNPSQIDFINTNTDAIEKTWSFEVTTPVSLMAYESGSIYFYASQVVYKLDETAAEVSYNEVSSGNILYGLNVKNDKLFTLKRAFTNLSKLTVVNAESGLVEYETAVGLGASKIYFTE